MTAGALSTSVIMALALSAGMIATVVFIIFYHDRKHVEIDQWIAYAFSGHTLRNALLYYRFMAISMLVFYILFTINCLLLQADGYTLFQDAGGQAVSAGPIGTSLFTLDLVLRGGFFDVMEHFGLSVTAVHVKKGELWFLWYSFIFRMFFGLTLIKILLSFVWIYGRIRLASQAGREERPASLGEAQPRK